MLLPPRSGKAAASRNLNLAGVASSALILQDRGRFWVQYMEQNYEIDVRHHKKWGNRDSACSRWPALPFGTKSWPDVIGHKELQ
jgi:hypothetical protein